MPAVKLNTVLQSILTKAGLDVNLPANQALLDATASIEWEKEESDKVDSALMTESIANIKLGGKIKREALDALDQNIAKKLETLNLDDAAKADIQGTKSTYEKLDKLHAYTLEMKQAGKGDSTDAVEKLTKKYNELVAKSSQTEAAHTKALEELKKSNDRDYTKYILKGKIAAMNLALPDSLSQEEKVNTVLYLLEQDMAQNKYQVALNADRSAKLAAEDGTDAIDGVKNIKVELDPYMQGFLAKKGLLANSDRPVTKDGSQASSVASQNPPKSTVNPAVAAEVRQQLEAAVNRA